MSETTREEITTPEAFLDELFRRLGQEGPGPELLEELLMACLKWPEKLKLRNELLLLLQELPAVALPLALSHALGQWLTTTLPTICSDLQPYSAWLLSCLRPLPAWESLERTSLEGVLPTGLPALFAEPLFTLLLLCTCLTDAGLEGTLTRLRAQVLASAAALTPDWELLLLMLAFQAWNNGYVWAETGPETQALVQLPEVRADVLGLLVLACYRPLQLLEQDALSLQKRSPLWQKLIAVSMQAPLREVRLAECLKIISPLPLNDPCLAFYEETPYPRWLAPELLAVEPLDEQLVALFPHHDWRSLKPEMDVLIAGCGTGQQVAQQALQLPLARLTAFDFSSRALGYAARMLEEFKIKAELVQTDLQQLSQWPQRFDLIACGGVLHHLEQPEAGLENLVRLLKPGGLLKLGVYSRRAREPLYRLRQKLGIHGGESQAQVRELRQQILADTSHEAQWVQQTRDFYSLPGCRDLLCHPRESAYGLPELAGWFSRLNLTVIGLELWNPQYYYLYQKMFPEDQTLSNLDSWDRFEARYPGVFAGMIVVWLQAAQAL